MIFGYCRVSGMGQVDGEGLPRQREAIHRAAPDVDRIFEEIGVTGKSDWLDRPAWIDMMSVADAGDTIVIERLDRLARDLGVQEHIIRDLKKRRINLISAAEPDLGSEDPTRVLFRQILGAIAQFDRAQIEAKLRHARERRRAQDGRCEGRKPFGEHPGEADTLAWMRALQAQGLTTRGIAQELTRHRAATRTGKPWHHSTVAKILGGATAGGFLEVASLLGCEGVRLPDSSGPEQHLVPELFEGYS